MMWSFSAHSSFRKCPRQWFYKQHVANARAKDPFRKEAHRLSKLEGIQAWRGKIVDSVISDTIIPSLHYGRQITLEQAKNTADQLFDYQRSQRQTDNGFFEQEYGLPLTKEIFIAARSDIHNALDNLYAANGVWAVLRQADALVPQRPLCFHHHGMSVRVVPDLITFHSVRPPVVFDWKVNTYALRDYWLQLVTGAMGVTRCNPHRDWSAGVSMHKAHEVTLYEIQLLVGDVREHSITEGDIQDAEDFIALSAAEMTLAMDGKEHKNLRPEDLPVTSEPRACQWCNFKKLCWRTS